MNAPWFDGNQWAWLPGTLFGCLGGLWGALAGTLAPQGRARRLVLGLGLLLIATAAAFVAVGLIALRTGQPFWVWFAFLLPGLQGVLVLSPLFPLVARRYREAEGRRIQAEDLN